MGALAKLGAEEMREVENICVWEITSLGLGDGLDVGVTRGEAPKVTLGSGLKHLGDAISSDEKTGKGQEREGSGLGG